MPGKRQYSTIAWLSFNLRRLGWFYGLGIVFAIAAISGFGKLAQEVLEGDVQPANLAFQQIHRAYSDPFLDRLALILTILGGVAGTTVVTCLMGLLYLYWRRTIDATMLGLAVLGGGVLATVLKHTFRQPRPELSESLAPAHGFGFPSGHTLLSVCLYGYLAAVLVLDGPRHRWRWVAAGALILLALSIGWSRLYLGVHWLSDVGAGCLAALFWLICCILARRYARFRGEPQG